MSDARHDGAAAAPLAEAQMYGTCASPLFRVLAGAIALLVLAIPYTIVEAWLTDAAMPDAAPLGGPLEIAFLGVLALSFGWVAVTGRMPKWLFKLFARSAKAG